MEVNQPLPSNEDLLVSSDTPSSKCIQYGMSAITGFSATSTQSKSRNKLRDSPLKAGRSCYWSRFVSPGYSVEAPPLCATVSMASSPVNHDVF